MAEKINKKCFLAFMYVNNILKYNTMFAKLFNRKHINTNKVSELPPSYVQSNLEALDIIQSDIQNNPLKYIDIGLNKFKSNINQLINTPGNISEIYYLCVPEWYNNWDSYNTDDEITDGPRATDGPCRSSSYINSILNTEFKKNTK